jgi:hypothetical protein
VTTYKDASVEHIRRLNRLIDKGGVQRLKRLYEQGQAELERKLGHVVGRGSSPFTVHQHRAMLAHVRQGQVAIAQRLGTASAQATVETQTDALHALVRNIKRLEKTHGSGMTPTLPIEEAAKFQGIVDKRKTSLHKQNKSSMARFGANVVKKLEHQMSLSLVTGESTGEAVERVARTADVEFWQVERIVRTEQAWAYSATQRDAIAETPELFMRWTELCDDPTAGWPHPMDDRVGADSVALHGIVAKPGSQFEMPSNATSIRIMTRYGESRVFDDMIGQSWDHPPNRPNDRAVIMPWHPEWGVPGWEVVGGRRIKHKVGRGRRGLSG